MILRPENAEDLARQLSESAKNSCAISGVNLDLVNRLVEHVPADMTATVETGIRLADFQNELLKQGQWIPLDPPDANATVHDLIAKNLSGPRRFGYGTVRDYLIGLKAVLGEPFR